MSLSYFFKNKKEETLFIIKLNLEAVQSHLSKPWVPETFLARFPALGQHRKFPLYARKNSGTQGNLSTTSSLKTEESGRCKQV